MTDKEKKNKIADILLDFYDEHSSNEINRPMIPSIYAGKILDSLQEEPKPKFKVGQTITDPTDSTFTFHINKIEDGRYIEKKDEWVLVKEADANYELVEEPVSSDLSAEIDYLSKRYPEVSFAKLSRIAIHTVRWQKEKAINWLKSNVNCGMWIMDFKKSMEE